MRAPALIAFLLFAPALLLASAPAPTSPAPAAPPPAPAARAAAQPSVAVISSSSSTCPVGFDVHRNSPGLVANVGDPSRHRGSQRIFFTLSPAGENTPRSIELTVHAISPGPRIYPVQSLAEPAPEIHRSFQLSMPDSPGPHGRNLWVDNVGGILSVDLTSITYADGTVWHASAASTCHAVPNGFTPVNATLSQQ